MLSNLLLIKPDLTTLLMLCAALVVAPFVYFLYVQARLGRDLRRGLNPSQVRMGAVALALATFGVLLAFSKTWGMGWSLIAICMAMGLSWAGRNRGGLILLLVGAIVLVVLIVLLRPSAL